MNLRRVGPVVAGASFAFVLAVQPSAWSASVPIDTEGVSRLSGANRYQTAAAVSETIFPTTDVAFLAAGTTFPDALSGGPAALIADAPVLLTAGSSLPQATLEELQRSTPATVYVLGGKGAIPDSVVSQVESIGSTVERLAGDDRFSTGVAISNKFWTTSETVYLATSGGFSDALSGGALAAKTNSPVLLSASTQLPAVVAAELARLAPSEVVLLGGTSSLSSSVSGQVKAAVPGVSVSRLAGTDRYATSAAIADAGWNTSTRVFYASGANFPDALAGVAGAAANDAPLLLTRDNCSPSPIAATTARLSPTTKVILGGEAVIKTSAVTTTCITESGSSLGSSINKLRVANETNTGYDRDLFRHWIDADGDCQDTRDEVLAQESLIAVSGCDIATGRWHSYYDRAAWTQASDVDIDHLVALSEAWGSGARLWNGDTRERFANDLSDSRALVAVTDNVNQSKSDKDPSQWLPTYDKCRYVKEWTAIKLRWSLTVDTAEKNALSTTAAGCPATTVSYQRAAIGAGPPPPTPTPTPTPTPPGGLQYERTYSHPRHQTLTAPRSLTRTSSSARGTRTGSTLTATASAARARPLRRLQLLTPAGAGVKRVLRMAPSQSVCKARTQNTLSHLCRR